MDEQTLLADFVKCQDCNKFKDCKNLKQGKCLALDKTNFMYDCPFYYNGKPKVEIDKTIEFNGEDEIEFLKWLLKQDLNVRAVGVLSTGEKYNITKTIIKRIINKLEG